MPCSSWRNIGKQSGKKKKDRDSSTQKKGHAKAFRLPFLLYKIQGRCSNLYRHYHFTPTSLVNFPHKTHRGYLRNAEKRINKAKVRMISTHKKKKNHLICIIWRGNCHIAEALRFTKLTNVLIYQIEHALSFPKLKESLLPTHASSSER